jgi:hypothetical protein
MQLAPLLAAPTANPHLMTRRFRAFLQKCLMVSLLMDSAGRPMLLRVALTWLSTAATSLSA